MTYRSEAEMYPAVVSWLQSVLKYRHRRDCVTAYNTSQTELSRFLQQNDLHALFPDYLTYELQVDVTAIIHSPKAAKLAFVECKLKPITLRDISQILGYSRVAKPLYSFIISPKGISQAVSYLLQTYQRFDVLEYEPGKRIKVATWSKERGEIIASSVLPPGEYL